MVDHTAENDAPWEHDFLPVAGHPDDDECTYRSDGTDATYCGRPAADHDHHPNCYQSTGEIPDDLPDDLCDCRILHALQNPLIGPDGFTRLAGNRVIPPAQFPVPDGWHAFGTHIDQDVRLEFSTEEGEDGLPLWERPIPSGSTGGGAADGDRG